MRMCPPSSARQRARSELKLPRVYVGIDQSVAHSRSLSLSLCMLLSVPQCLNGLICKKRER
jgi:hypothetical protein